MEDTVHSPCTNQCFVPPGTNLCTGCYRTIQEIIDWLNLTDDGKVEILKRIDYRKKVNEKIG
ncbi:MAG: DUF1289 domain-containing protein [Melioribacteraceae bacterium]|nr:DUF1289 domain-containing protein [Melioribacteraceae bacterium]